MDAESQAAPFRIPTKDGERLFSWLIAPLGVYSKHADRFIDESSSAHDDIEDKLAFRLLRADPEARLLVYCTDDEFHSSDARLPS